VKNLVYVGAIFSILSALCYALQISVIKMTGAHIPVPVLVFIQSFICLLMVVPVIGLRHGAKSFNPITFSNIKMQHFLRTIFSLGISFFLFTALKKISYFDSVLLYNTFPLFIPFVALIILRTKINHALWPFVFIGFAGVMLTLHLDKHIFSTGAFYALGSAVSAGLSIVMMRKISAIDDSVKSLYYYFLISTILAGFVSIPFWHEVSNLHVLSILLIGILFFFVQYFLTLAATYTTPQIVSTLYYSNIVFSLILAHALFSEVITKTMIVGMIGIVIGGLGVIYMRKNTVVVKSNNILVNN